MGNGGIRTDRLVFPMAKVEEHKEILELGLRMYYLRGKTNTTHKHLPTNPSQAVVSSHLSAIRRVSQLASANHLIKDLPLLGHGGYFVFRVGSGFH